MITEQTQLTTEQTELLEKLNCLEFETSQLNRAYQLWKTYVEKGTAPEWMVSAIKISYNTLIMFCLDTAKHLAKLEAAASEISGILGDEGTSLGTSKEYLPMREPDWSGPEMPVAISQPSNGEAVWEQPTVQLVQQEQERLRHLWSKALVYDTTTEASPEYLPMTESTASYTKGKRGRKEKKGKKEKSKKDLPVASSQPSTGDAVSKQQLWAQALGYETTAQPSPEYLPMTEPEWSGAETPVAISQPSTSDEIWEQPAVPMGKQEEDRLRQLWAKALVYDTTAQPSPEYLPMTEPEWSESEMQLAISPLSPGEAISRPPAIQFQQEIGETGAHPTTIHSLATLANWLHGSTEVLFVMAPGTMGRLFRAFAAMLIVAGGAIGIYMLSAQHTALKPALAAGVVATPTSEKAGFKFDPDPVVARLGRSFVVNAVLSRGSDITSLAAQIDYDNNFLKFVGVSEGSFLKDGQDGQQVVLTQRDDPLTGIVRISADKSPANSGISGEGTVFALSFQAKRRGKATVSIVPGAHDSQGRRIEMAGNQVSVKVD
jgi:hypothetical protein